MRLSSLKVSGFKSFADSTTLHFKANRSAIVGPNGCGKSNVIDAVRWVMGESNARQLRGGNMQDVIFTGTAKRKPVGLASVELRFENTQGKLGGAYNAYNELAVRRQVSRDGKSEYFLNGTRCRRRDITDIFLGTGLGPRSYAIIEQGMINRLVDAKPEEMRVYIEEAAGISRYQARRRETLQHLEHTTQNLLRLEDIAHELNGQLKALKRQAETAIQYKSLETQIHTLKVEILSFQSQQSTRLQHEYHVQLDSLGEKFKHVRSELTTLEHDLGSTNDLFQRLIQQSSPLQREWQEAEKKRAALEMTLQQKQALFEQNNTQLTQYLSQKQHSKERLQLIDIQLDDLCEQQNQRQQQWLQYDAEHQQNIQQSSNLKQQHQQAQQAFENIKLQVDQYQQKHAQMLSQSEQLQKNILRLNHQKETLDAQQLQVKHQVEDEQVQALLAQQQQGQTLLVEVEQQLFECEQRREATQQQLLDMQQQRSELQSDIQGLQREQKNLQQLMAQQLPSHRQPILQLLQVLQLTAQGKQHAGLVEKFLAKWLSAAMLESSMTFQTEQARQLKVSLAEPTLDVVGLPSLSTWIVEPQLSIWQQVALAPSLDYALALQTSLAAGESILTLDGYHIGSDWVIGLFFDEDSQAAQGALSHQVRLDEIAAALIPLQQQFTHCVQQISELEKEQRLFQQQQQQFKQQLKQQQQQQQQTDVQIAKLQSSQQAFSLQQQQLAQQIQQLEVQLEEDAMQKDDLEIDLHALQIKLEQLLPEHGQRQAALEALETHLMAQQEKQQFSQQHVDENRQQLTQLTQQIELLEKDQSFLKTQQQQLQQQIALAQNYVDPIQLELPTLLSQLEQQSEIADKLQQQWTHWQDELNSVQSRQQQLTTQRHEYQQQDELLRNTLEQTRLAWQAAKSDIAHYAQQLNELQAQPLLEVKIDLDAHQQSLQTVQQKLSKLGAVNLAASEEYQDVSTRHAELTHQMQDLENTVEQLQQAMKSIDQETKKLFMNTFEKINVELQALFPKVFNGGEASLSLEGDWQSGVKLMARPPGKRNSSLALLSGGEKALTALALVFAIFRLNPAPFCVLDEVDAPLDDANVQRFCNLVKELSEQVQFIYITHNKLAMTMATDLLGVTMPEPGASKLVTVNLEEAKEYGLVAES
ncbi:chromosome segregation protein SMC [Acinetobacter sp. MD2(2019)]|uniref:chromosome segregation protein SMC n=1 Tax=Acinetobacter sp. MD2(2019) TaxID=2605273 RepID=UPI002D1E94B2|nr:chromosome segregation protein SMC [Acinetobacter sp. MD2(2019)]MEB3753960.1 chromosome segregation protein SMC [Acinetobacter sp. MD2(2019)]